MNNLLNENEKLAVISGLKEMKTKLLFLIIGNSDIKNMSKKELRNKIDVLNDDLTELINDLNIHNKVTLDDLAKSVNINEDDYNE